MQRRTTKKRKKPSLNQKQEDATQMGCVRCGGSARIAPRKLSRKVSSKLAARLVSVASFNGDKMLHECTGIFIKTSNANTLSVLTSFTLVGYDEGLNYMKYGYRDISRIDVKLPDGQVADAKLVHSHDYFDLAILNINNIPPGFHPKYLCLDHGEQFESYIDVVAAWRSHTTGEIKTAMGTLEDIPTDNRHYWSSSCNIEMPGLGGALIDYDGKFIGMSSSHGTTTEYLTTCIPWHKILKCLRYFEMLPPITLEQERAYDTRKSSTSEIQKYSTDDEEFMCYLGEGIIHHLYHLATTWGYPLPDPRQACEGMYLKYSFEEEFGENISSILSSSVAFKVSQNIVSLASFNGKTRFFACTGVFISYGAHSAKILTSASLVRDSGDEIKINHNLRIEVRLPNNRRGKGILKYCNLCYNIAIIDIMDSWSHPGMKLQGHKPISNGMDIVAVGCLFEERTLMAPKGTVIDKNTDWQHIPSDSELSFSTCKIAKAGIGGPLIDAHGNIVGMNFYHEECTPFLSSSTIRRLLKDDFRKDICAKCLKDGPVVTSGINRWTMTEPSWCYPEPVMPEDSFPRYPPPAIRNRQCSY